MSVSKTIVKSCTGANGNLLTGTYSYTADEEINLSVLQAGSTTNTGYAVGSYAASGIQSFYALATQNCTVKFNSSSSPPLTLNLTAGIPYTWDVNCGFSNPFPSSTTEYYVTVSGSNSCQLDIAVLVAA